jgi:hypothetical protein
MVYNDDSSVVLQHNCEYQSNWRIQSATSVHNLTGFLIFMNALNHYLFAVIQFDPISQMKKTSSDEYEYYFDRIYFDMGTGEFVSTKKISLVSCK